MAPEEWGVEPLSYILISSVQLTAFLVNPYRVALASIADGDCGADERQDRVDVAG